MFRGESELFYGQSRMFFGQNRVSIFITEVKSAGGASESFRTGCLFLKTALKSSEHRVFHAGMGETFRLDSTRSAPEATDPPF